MLSVLVSSASLSSSEIAYPPSFNSTEELALKWFVESDVVHNGPWDIAAQSNVSASFYGQSQWLEDHIDECEWVGVAVCWSERPSHREYRYEGSGCPSVGRLSLLETLSSERNRFMTNFLYPSLYNWMLL